MAGREGKVAVGARAKVERVEKSGLPWSNTSLTGSNPRFALLVIKLKGVRGSSVLSLRPSLLLRTQVRFFRSSVVTLNGHVVRGHGRGQGR